MGDYRKLNVWQKSMALAAEIYRVTEKLPARERFALSIQLRRAAVSIPSNIAEGGGRRSDAEFRRFVDIAYGSLIGAGNAAFTGPRARAHRPGDDQKASHPSFRYRQDAQWAKEPTGSWNGAAETPHRRLTAAGSRQLATGSRILVHAQITIHFPLVHLRDVVVPLGAFGFDEVAQDVRRQCRLHDLVFFECVDRFAKRAR